MTVYVEWVVILNFFVDFLLLLGTNRISGVRGGGFRCALAAGVGALYARLCLLPGFPFLGEIQWRFAALCLMTLAAFGLQWSAMSRGGLYLLLRFALAGIAMSIGREDLLSLLLCAGALWGLTQLSPRQAGQEHVPVTIRHKGKTVSFTALRDTGNTLRDPVTGESVLVVSGDIGARLLGLGRDDMARPMETLLRRPRAGLRLIPYRAIGTGGMLLGMSFPDVTIGSKRGRAVVAFAPEGIESTQGFQGLCGGTV